ncbi:hypothetical protein DFH07DRAFT_774704 [Mycena maculata]|uniref:Uncharacterized protein n=1 Tax=Mycena maculata TaxID=230809 RepID=A0AAD7N9U1_9AGAR|nr:hypothetical protein DFH07DRAFT_774704 [Mycena maculata]
MGWAHRALHVVLLLCTMQAVASPEQWQASSVGMTTPLWKTIQGATAVDSKAQLPLVQMSGPTDDDDIFTIHLYSFRKDVGTKEDYIEHNLPSEMQLFTITETSPVQFSQLKISSNSERPGNHHADKKGLLLRVGACPRILIQESGWTGGVTWSSGGASITGVSGRIGGVILGRELGVRCEEIEALKDVKSIKPLFQQLMKEEREERQKISKNEEAKEERRIMWELRLREEEARRSIRTAALSKSI